MLKRAYSTFEVKAVNDEQRTIDGIATTPTPDRMDDIVEPMGGEYKLPLPFLYQHNSRQPIGTVVAATESKDGIRVKIQMGPAGIVPFIDEAWALIKAKLIRGLSIGFRSLEESYNNDTGGYRYLRWEWMELSAVTIPANTEATILAVKSADDDSRAALGIKRDRVVQLDKSNFPGVTGLQRKKNMKPKLSEQISQWEAKRAASEARIEELMAKSAEAGTTLDVAEEEEYDGLTEEIKKIDAHIKRLKDQEARAVAKATAVGVGAAASQEDGQRIRTSNSSQIQVNRNANLPQGIGFARVAICLAKAGGKRNAYTAMELAKKHYPDMPEVEMMIKTAVEAGDTTTSGWASQLLPAAQLLAGEFLDMLRPMTIMGRIPGLRMVPFNVAVPLQSGSGTYGYVGEGAGKPVTKPTLGSATLRFEKAAGIIVITQELARFGSPSAELLVRNELLKGLSTYFDTIFVSQGAAVSNVQPAGILNGINQTLATGTTAAKFRVDMNTIMQNFITNNQDPTTAVILMSNGVAMSLSAMTNSLGQPEFPTINSKGGTYLGIPIVTSQSVGSRVVLINADNILLAEDPAMTIDVSTEASVEMDTEPVMGESSPASQISQLKSFWQNDLIGFRVEQFRTWKVARTSAVEWINNAAYTVS